RAASQFERPRDAVAAGGMSMPHRCRDPHLSGHRRLPAGSDPAFGSRMHGNAVRIHFAGNADYLVRGVSDQREGGSAGHSPAVNKLVTADTPEWLIEIGLNDQFIAGGDAEDSNPLLENERVDAVGSGERIEVDLRLRFRLERGRKAVACGGDSVLSQLFD